MTSGEDLRREVHDFVVRISLVKHELRIWVRVSMDSFGGNQRNQTFDRKLKFLTWEGWGVEVYDDEKQAVEDITVQLDALRCRTY